MPANPLQAKQRAERNHQIKEVHKATGMKLSELASLFNLSPSRIWQILHATNRVSKPKSFSLRKPQGASSNKLEGGDKG